MRDFGKTLETSREKHTRLKGRAFKTPREKWGKSLMKIFENYEERDAKDFIWEVFFCSSLSLFFFFLSAGK